MEPLYLLIGSRHPVTNEQIFIFVPEITLYNKSRSLEMESGIRCLLSEMLHDLAKFVFSRSYFPWNKIIEYNGPATIALPY